MRVEFIKDREELELSWFNYFSTFINFKLNFFLNRDSDFLYRVKYQNLQKTDHC